MPPGFIFPQPHTYRLGPFCGCIISMPLKASFCTHIPQNLHEKAHLFDFHSTSSHLSFSFFLSSPLGLNGPLHKTLTSGSVFCPMMGKKNKTNSAKRHLHTLLSLRFFFSPVLSRFCCRHLILKKKIIIFIKTHYWGEFGH